MPQPCSKKHNKKPTVVWGSSTLGSCVCHKRSRGTCAFWWVCSVRQINSVSGLYNIRSFTDSSGRKLYSYPPKKDATHLTSFISWIEITTKYKPLLLSPQEPEFFLPKISTLQKPPRCRLCKTTLWEVFELGCGRRSFGSFSRVFQNRSFCPDRCFFFEKELIRIPKGLFD